MNRRGFLGGLLAAPAVAGVAASQIGAPSTPTDFSMSKGFLPMGAMEKYGASPNVNQIDQLSNTRMMIEEYKNGKYKKQNSDREYGDSYSHRRFREKIELELMSLKSVSKVNKARIANEREDKYEEEQRRLEWFNRIKRNISFCNEIEKTLLGSLIDEFK